MKIDFPGFMSGAADAVLSLLFPRRCLGCGGALPGGLVRGAGSAHGGSAALCVDCRASVVVARSFFCAACGARRFGANAPCHPDFPYLLAAASQYENPALQSLVQALKFRYARRAAEPLSSIIRDYLDAIGPFCGDFAGFTVMPIPLSRRRLRARGFNQADLIARPIAMRLGLPLDTMSLVRIRHTKPQTETRNAFERRENLRDCFAVRRPLGYANILLVDDVTTTGTTFLEAARTLKRSGAGKIIALAALRA